MGAVGGGGFTGVAVTLGDFAVTESDTDAVLGFTRDNDGAGRSLEDEGGTGRVVDDWDDVDNLKGRGSGMSER